jgi:aminoglycoside phosphotransferase (APT) family kinase protein
VSDDVGCCAAAKLARPDLPGRRVDAEAHVLRELGPRHGLPVPRLLARVDDDLLIEWIDDGASAAAPPSLDAIIGALARVHAVRPTEQDRARLATWGRGTAGDARPFARRAARLHRRTEGFLDLLPAEVRSAWRRRLGALAGRFAASCARQAALAGDRLIHGDLHRGNVRGGPRGIRLIDWQHASVGPPLVDLVRLLVETGPPDAARALQHVATQQPDASPADIGAVLDATMAGLVSGFGGRTSAELAPWERTIIDRAFDERGWLAHHAERHAGARTTGGGGRLEQNA